jgi:membrane protease subunit HflK
MERKEKAVLIAIGANLFLVALKFFLAGISGSMALQMSGWHSVQGLFVSVAVFIGFILSRKEESRITRGISQTENVVALLISLFVFYLAYKMFIKMTSPHMAMLTNVPIVTLGAILGATICYMMARFKVYVGQATHSPSLVADGYHCRIHVVMEIAVIIGLAGYLVGFTNLDMLAAVVVTLFVLQTGFRLFTRALVSLTSKKVSPDYSCHVEEGGLRLGRPKTAITLASVVLLAYISTGFYTIQWNERGIVRRFGQQIGEKIPPGFHYHLPWPIDSVDSVKVDDIRKLDTGSFLMLTGDENLIQLNVATHYQIKDASDYLYNLEDPEKLVRDATRSALIIPEARGKAAKIVMKAEGFRAERVNHAQGEASRFLLQHKEHDRAREVTEMRLYIETMEEALAPVEKILINPDVKQGVMDIWFFGKDAKKMIIE